LALCLIDGPDRDLRGAVEQLQAIAQAKEMPEHPYVLYYLGQARRGLGVKELEQAAAKPQEAQQRRAEAAKRFDEAIPHFAAATAAFSAAAKPPAATAKELAPDLEWAARARCDQAEMQLRTQKVKEARDTASPFADDSSVLAKSRYRSLGLYYHGFACFLLRDQLQAAKSLNRATVFADPHIGSHARYLVGRIHHLNDERAEAAVQYEAAVAGHNQQVASARQALKQPERFKDDPQEKARLTVLVNNPPPDHVARSTFHLAELLYESGRFAEASARLTEFIKQFPKSELTADAVLRQGFCQVQLKQHAEAIRTLQPLGAQEPRLADQCSYWIAKAQAGSVDPANSQALQTAINTYQQAAQQAQ